MKHFTVKLFDENRQTRQWSVWADRLTVGSDPRCALVVPAPAPALAGSFLRDAVVDLPFGRLDVAEDTSSLVRMWDLARDRMERSRLLGSNDPGERMERARAFVLSGLGVLAVAGMVTLVRIGQRAAPPDDAGLPVEILELLPPAPEKEPPPPKADPAPAQSETPKPGPTGGPSEDHTDHWTETANPQKDVMDHSVLTKLASMDAEALVGESVDDETSNEMDVFLRGDAGASMRKSGLGGHSSGDGDRMAGLSGVGLGNGGPAGRGMGTGSRAGRLTQGAGGPGTGLAQRARIAPPKPSDVELGGEAGSRSAESILRVIRSNIGGFQYSYQKYLRENPALGGKLSLRFTIAPSGDVVQISLVESNTGNAALDEEIKDKARRMRFDPIEKGNVTVTYAFVLDRQ